MSGFVRPVSRNAFDDGFDRKDVGLTFGNLSAGQPWSRDEFFRPFEQALDSIINRLEGFDPKSIKQNSGYPRLDLISHDNKFLVEVSIPGVEPEDVRVEIHPGQEVEGFRYKQTASTLIVSGKMNSDKVREGAHYHVRELSRKAFSRSISLPHNIEGDPQVTFTNGLLTLSWSLVDEEAKKKPDVKVIPVPSPAFGTIDLRIVEELTSPKGGPGS